MARYVFSKRLKCDKVTTLSLTLALIMNTGHFAFETYRVVKPFTRGGPFKDHDTTN